MFQLEPPGEHIFGRQFLEETLTAERYQELLETRIF